MSRFTTGDDLVKFNEAIANPGAVDIARVPEGCVALPNLWKIKEVITPFHSEQANA